MNYAIEQLKKEIKQEKQDFTINLNEWHKQIDAI